MAKTKQPPDPIRYPTKRKLPAGGGKTTYVRLPEDLHASIMEHVNGYGGTCADFIRTACHQELKRRRR